MNTLKIDRIFVLVSAFYLSILPALRRGLFPHFILGGALGIFFLPLLKNFIASKEKSVLESVLFQFPLAVLSLYATSSLASTFGQGFILTVFLQTILRQSQQWLRTDNINTWFWPIKGGVSFRTSVIYFVGIVSLFLLSTLLLG